MSVKLVQLITFRRIIAPFQGSSRAFKQPNKSKHKKRALCAAGARALHVAAAHRRAHAPAGALAHAGASSQRPSHLRALRYVVTPSATASSTKGPTNEERRKRKRRDSSHTTPSPKRSRSALSRTRRSPNFPLPLRLAFSVCPRATRRQETVILLSQ